MIPWILVIIGLILIYLEFYLPGGIMGAFGAASFIGGIILAFIQYESPFILFGFLIFSFLAFGFTIKLALWRIKRTKEAGTLYSDSNQEGFIASHFETSALGKIGIVASDLKPGGHIMIEEKKHSAISQSGYLTQGTKVKVIGGEGETLIVKLFKED